jgi:hypothetical protein
MSSPQVKLLKSVDIPEKASSIPSDDRDFWMAIRHALLQQLATIEKKLGISRRCPHCGNDVRQRSLG